MSKIFHSNSDKDKIVCNQTYKLLLTLHRLGLEFDSPIKEVLQPLSMDGVMLDRFIRAFIRIDDGK